MGVINNGDLVLVTGASGYLGAHTVEAFLDAGYPVRGTVRSHEKGKYLADLFASKSARFEYAIVDDIGRDGAFDEAVVGIQGVAHTASPFHFNADDPDEVIRPALEGTLGILKSLQKTDPEVKRIVLTSSIAAIENSSLPAPHRLTEEDWNPISVGVVEKYGREAENVEKYRASKILAERAFWKFFETEHPNFDGVAINAAFILGPILHECTSPRQLNTSVGAFWQLLSGQKSADDLPDAGTNLIDVRDCALMHVKALQSSAAGGQRFIASNGPISGNEYCLVLNEHHGDLQNVPRGDPTIRRRLIDEAVLLDGSKAERVLDFQYTPVEKTINDMAVDLRHRFKL